MSFVKTLATLAVGFAAAKGAQKMRDMGGMDAVKNALRSAGDKGGMGDQLGAMAEKFGVPGGAETVRGLMGKFGGQAADMTEASQAGLGALMGAMTGAASAGAAGVSDMMGAMTGGTPVGEAMEENAKMMIRAMIQAAKADGEIDAEERSKILDALSDASEEEMAFVQGELDADIDVARFASDMSESARAQVYSAALMAISVDTEAEKQYLAQLASALALPTQKVATIHETMGKPFI
ncbi:Inner membrane protein YebE [Aquimixticola soesokkakensis]|uniref:Inner membrane protein YebE n=1 Tax=Aquimixticola soesokkakensis TaxID=1519096 RepID=A0A1Y5TF62_9RHOB|nr:tellurite resistance TerB family protein [Aquimixticola soesokkakensis]SLN58880.1 Inner membrane protein YebE [Aquimixticola soesokkakensis]